MSSSNQWLLVSANLNNEEENPMSLQFPTAQMSADYRHIETADEAVEFIVRMLRGSYLVRDWPFILAKATKDLHIHDEMDRDRHINARDNSRALQKEWVANNDR